MQRMLRLPQVLERTGMSRSTIYSWMDRQEFPAPVKLGPRAIAWRDADIEAWLEARQPARAAA